MVIKKDGTKEPFDINKIFDCINKAADRVGKVFPEEKKEGLEDFLYDYFSDSPISKDDIKTSDLHLAVIRGLNAVNELEIADSYREYRDYKESYAKAWEDIRKSADDIIYLGDRENANFDSSLSSTKGSLIRGATTKALYKQFYLSKEEKELIKRGDIYIHDLRDMILNNINCCLFDIGNVLKGGFEMSNVKYSEPKSVLAALQVIGDITLVATAQQFGGFTLPELDKVLLPYCKRTYYKAWQESYSTFTNSTHAECCEYAWKKLKEELRQGFQALELKLNTVPCSRGDFAFTTITFGTWDLALDDLDRDIMKLIGKTILQTRMKGHGGTPVVFPKLVFLYDKNKIEEDAGHKELFEEAIKCSASCMYPDYLSLTGDPARNVVAQTYLTYGVITSPMGCRAYLTPWADPETGRYVATGRCNIGAVSLNLPVIMEYCKKTYRKEWREYFWAELYKRLQVIRKFFKKRYDTIRHTKACTNPLAFTQGGLYKGNLKPDDEIGDLVNYMTASFGITALNEATLLWCGKTLKETQSFAKDVLEYINQVIGNFKKVDGYLYALYGTPAESLCQTQAQQYAAYCGDEGSPFGEYFTNSFHLHVSEDITPFEKQDYEHDMFHMVNGGHIQYVRIDNPENIEAIKAVVERGMDYGFYQGVNFDSAYCNHCGGHSYNVMSTCPYCGSHNLTVISRVCGYLGYSNVNGKTRMNDGKMAEIRDRKSM